MRYLDEAGEGWRSAFVPLIEGLVVDQGEAMNLAFGMAFDVRNLLAEEWLATYAFDFAKEVVATTQGALELVIQQGMKEGWAIPTMQSHLTTLFRQWMEGDLSKEDFEWFEERMPPHRTEMIARTETIRASNRGHEALYKNWGVTWKEWLTAIDERTCVFCLDMDGKRFVVGTTLYAKGSRLNVQVPKEGGGYYTHTLKLDYEDVKGPPLHPNCRCVLLPWKEGWASESPPIEETAE